MKRNGNHLGPAGFIGFLFIASSNASAKHLRPGQAEAWAGRAISERARRLKRLLSLQAFVVKLNRKRRRD